jgi:excinuclease ABC subunit B
MAKNPDNPKKPGKTPKSKAHRPDVQPIGPALAELLNPAINRGESGIGSSTGLQPPPDNSWDRRSGGEAAAHRARASTRGTSDDVAKRDASPTSASSPSPTHESELRSSRPRKGRGSKDASNEGAEKQGFGEAPQSEFAPANYGTSATIPTLDPELAKQLGFTTEEEDAAALARPPRNKMEALGVAATADALDNLIREGRPEFKG